MGALSTFMSGFLSANQIALGRLVTDTKNPTRKFHDSKTFELSTNKYSRNEFTNIYALTEAKSSSTFEIALTMLLDLLIKKSDAANSSVKSDRAVRYELLNPEDRLDEILGDAAKVWVENAKKRSKIYLVTEIHAIQDASLSLGRSETAEAKGEASLPVSAIAEAVAPGSTTLNPGGGALATAVNPKIKIGKGKNRGVQISLMAPGERIIAVGYYEVILGRKQNELPELAKKVVWRSFDGSRGDKDKQIEIEAYLRGVDACPKQGQAATMFSGPNGTFIIHEDSPRDN